MPVVRMDALCACDACNKRFGVELDIAQELKRGPYEDFEAFVRDAVRGGQSDCYVWGVRGKATVDRMPLKYQATIQGGLLLCDDCSQKCDAVPIEGNLTREQVNEALGFPIETL